MNAEHYRILLVEDDEDDYLLTRDLLRDALPGRHTLTWLARPAEVLALGPEPPFEVALVDYRLGAQDGLDLVRQLTAQGWQIPLIILTGQGSFAVDVEALRAGATDYLVKHEVTAPLLERTIRYAQERCQARDTLRRAHDELEQRVAERTRELAAANAELRESEARFRALAENTSSAIFILQDGLIRYVNPAGRLITGYESAELLEKPFTAIAHPTYRELLRRNGLISQWAENAPARFELKLLNRSGAERWVDITSGEMEYQGRPAQVVTMFDITERDLAEQALQAAKRELEERVEARTQDLKRANRRLQLDLTERELLVRQLESERARLAAVFAQAPEAIILVNADGGLLLANPVAERLLGAPLVPGTSARDAIEAHLRTPHGDPLPGIGPLSRAATYGEACTNVAMILAGDGARRELLVSVAPIWDHVPFLEGGGLAPRGAVALLQDVTDLKLAEQRHLHATAQIELQHHLIQNRELERLQIAQALHDGSLQALIAISLDLAASLEDLQPGSLADRLSACWRALQVQIGELRGLCAELRPPALAPLGLEKAIRSHLDGFSARHPELTVTLDLAHDGQQLSEATRLSLYRIYQELLTNVARHAQASQVQVRFSLVDDWAELEVVDDGRGLPATPDWVELARQGHLGLVGVQERVEALAGWLMLEAADGGGTRARVQVPAGPLLRP